MEAITRLLNLAGRFRGAALALGIYLAVVTPVALAQPLAFSPVPGSPFTDFGDALAFSQSGSLMASAGSNGPVSVFAVGSGGTLTLVGSAGRSALGSPSVGTASAVAFSPSGALLASVGLAPNSVSVFSLASDGTPTQVPGSPFPLGGDGLSVAFSPSGALLAVADSNDVSIFSVAANGALTPVAGSPFAVASIGPLPSGPTSVAFSPNGTLLATADFIGQSVSVFSVSSAGSLTPVSGSPYAVTGGGCGPVFGNPFGPESVAFSPSGSLLATADGYYSNSVSVFSVASSGALTQVAHSPFPVGPSICGILPRGEASAVAFNATGDLLAAASASDSTVSVLSVDAQGVLSQLAGSPYALARGSSPNSVAFSPVGNLLAVPDYGGTDVLAPLTGPPASTTLPLVSGSAKVGQEVTCSTGGWSNAPTLYAYEWNRDGTPISHAAGNGYSVQKIDEGSSLTCTVTASNLLGKSSATSPGVIVKVPSVPPCPTATGRLSGRKLGLIALGMTRAQARHAYGNSSDRRSTYEDFFCLTPAGIWAGYPSRRLKKTLPAFERRRVAGRVIWTTTSNPYFSLQGIRIGAAVAAVKLRFPTARVVAHTTWYLAPFGRVSALIEIKRGIVAQVGIAQRALTKLRGAQRALFRSLPI